MEWNTGLVECIIIHDITCSDSGDYTPARVAPRAAKNQDYKRKRLTCKTHEQLASNQRTLLAAS